MSDQTPETFSDLQTFLAGEIGKLEANRREATFAGKRVIDKRLKPLRALQKKAAEVRGK